MSEVAEVLEKAAELSKQDFDLLTLVCLTGGGRTWQLAKAGNLQPKPATTAAVRRRLTKLEARGLVQRSARYTAINDIFWVRTSAGENARQASRNAEGAGE